jgi:hypothetical protein
MLQGLGLATKQDDSVSGDLFFIRNYAYRKSGSGKKLGM